MGACRCNAACNRVRVRNQARTPASFGPANGVRNIREFRTEALEPSCPMAPNEEPGTDELPPETAASESANGTGSRPVA